MGTVESVVTAAAVDDLTGSAPPGGWHHATEEAAAAAAASPWITLDIASALQQRARYTPPVADRLGGNPACPPDVLAYLAVSSHSTGDGLLLFGSAHRSVLKNPSTPWWAVCKASLGRPALRRAAASPSHLLSSPNCPPHLLVCAVNEMVRGRFDDAAYDRAGVLTNPSLPVEARTLALARLLPRQSRSLLSNPSLTHAEATQILERDTVRRRLPNKRLWAQQTGADPQWLSEVAALRDQVVSRALAQNPSSPAVVLAGLDVRPDVTSRLLANPSAPPAALLNHLQAARSTGSAQLRTAAANPAADSAVLALVPARLLSGTVRHHFVLRHAETAAQATTVYALIDSWSGSAASLLDAAAHILSSERR